MPLTIAATLPPLRHTLLVAMTVIAAGSCWASTGDAAATDRMRADCRAEGAAGGLEGTELEAFVRACLSDLLSVKLNNIEQR